MSIANELSCDVAAAMLARKEDRAAESGDGLTEVVLEVHTTLRRLTNESRRQNRSRIYAPKESSATGGLAP